MMPRWGEDNDTQVSYRKAPVHKHLRTAFAVGVGLSPGILLPFVVALQLGKSESDTVLLALSFALTLTNIVVASTEASSVATVGQELRLQRSLGVARMRRFVTTNLIRSVPATILGMGFLVAIFAVRVPDPAELALAGGILLLGPIIGSISAVFSGGLIAQTMTFVPIATQGLRSVLPLLALLVWPAGVSLVLLCILFVAGECIRFACLWGSWSRNRRSHLVETETAEKLETRGLWWQFSSTSLTQTNPLVDKFFLAGEAQGSITAYELADKVSFAVYQVAYNFGLLQRLGGWSTGTGLESVQRFRRDLVKLMLGTLALAAVGAVGLTAVLLLGWLPEAWILGAQWSMIALFAMPFAIGVTCCIRFIVISGAQRWLLPVTGSGVLVNAAFNLALLSWFGPIGIVLASIPTRMALFAGLLFVISRIHRDRSAQTGNGNDAQV